MSPFSHLLLLAILLAPRPAVASTVLLDEGFADLSAWDDLSTAVSWGDARAPPRPSLSRGVR